MTTPFYTGQVNLPDQIGYGNSRYFYGLRRTDDGKMYFTRVDQLTSQETITINVAGTAANNFENFEWGVDYFDGRLASDHSRPYPNLYWDQYRWDARSIYYYINSAGQLVARVNAVYNNYPAS